MTPDFFSLRNEDQLSFIEKVKAAFSLIISSGFVLVESNGKFVRLESDRVFIDISYGELSHHVDANIGRLREEDIYSLYEVLSVVVPSQIDRSLCQTADPYVLEQCLQNMADVLLKFCKPLLFGDKDAFDKLSAEVSSIRSIATLDAQYGASIARADQAWEVKDFQQARVLYESAKDGLNETRKRRLRYLVAHC